MLLVPGYLGSGLPAPAGANDELVVLISSRPENIDPRYADLYDLKLAFLCYARLVSVDDDSLTPSSSWRRKVTVLPADPAHRTNCGLGCSSPPAAPFDADDLVYTVERLADPKTGSPTLRRRFTESGMTLPPQIVDPHRALGPRPGVLSPISISASSAAARQSRRLARAKAACQSAPARSSWSAMSAR